ncbi:ABC transporter ATP-binding protein [Roseiarcaceae bacterium H3SJ34-1]|uniref:ABC transporter ATP-binding protein n=1 Tax=Terripilifer ovatus TaxID=3032367 RepID=UPI003AB9296B|nr:ABC transporter ATP-binding protein [Roseiarcaceae bacterium H3SJ34-1]
MADVLLSAQKVSKRFGGIVASDVIDLDVEAGTLHAIIGPNGAGKTTLVAQLSGELRLDSGEISFAGRDMTRLAMHERAQAGLVRSFQITSVVPQLTACENVALAVQAHDGHSFRCWKPARSDASLRDPALACLNEVGLAAKADRLVGSLAHGEKRALEIAMVLATRPKMLLLDEPMAGMGPEDSARLVALLAKLKQRFTILLIEHDMDAVFALADRITVLVYGRVMLTGSPGDVRTDPKVREAYLGEGAGS